MKVTFNNKPVEINTHGEIPSGIHLRVKLAPEQNGYSIYRERDVDESDELTTELMPLKEGGRYYSIPPSHM